MRHQINTATEAIDALGGDSAIADLFGFKDVRRIWNWHSPPKGRGLPAGAYAGMASLLAAKGLQFSPQLFKQFPVDRAAYRRRVNGNRE